MFLTQLLPCVVIVIVVYLLITHTILNFITVVIYEQFTDMFSNSVAVVVDVS